MRRTAATLLAVSLFGCGESSEEEPAGITEAEETRLVNVCIASMPEATMCLSLVGTIVQAAEERGCGYQYAATALEALAALSNRSEEQAGELIDRMPERCG